MNRYSKQRLNIGGISMNIKEVMDVFISGMGGNSETALSYILLGTLAATMAHSGFTNKLSSFCSSVK